MSIISSPPAGDSLIELEDERKPPAVMGKKWLLWLQDALLKRLQAAPEILLDNYEIDGLNSALGATPFPLGSLAAGVYTVEAYVRPTTADGVGSGVSVALGWTENALPLSRTVATVASDAVTDSANGRIRVKIDANSPLTFATLYASTTPGKMHYKLGFTVEAIAA